MAELLIELLSEEIPARMQAPAAARLAAAVKALMVREGLDCRAMGQPLCSPRRLAVAFDGLASRQPDIREERRGPRADAPDRAIAGFLKSVGLARDRLEERQVKNGVYLFAVIDRPGRATAEILAEALPALIAGFKWPKSMRWGDGELAWVRPLHGVLCIFDGAPVVADVGGGVTSGDRSRGHRFMAPEPFPVADFADYQRRLLAARVMVDPDRRRAAIIDQGRALETGTLAIDFEENLLREVTGLVEWPVVALGRIDPAFMALPTEVLVSAMRKHQKYFSLADKKTGAMAAQFAVVANLEAADGGGQIVAGNERVLRARLSDAKFFWDQDQRKPLIDRVAALGKVVFHAELGSLGDKAARIEALAAALAEYIPGAEPALAARAGRLAKADLTTEMVAEFPDLQGIMGRYYALDSGEPEAVALALSEHYGPQGPTAPCPTAPLSVAVALADKIDTLVGFFAIGRGPTGSKDPYALRRAALGVIRLILENDLRLPLTKIFSTAAGLHDRAPTGDLMEFLAERLKVHLKDRGTRHDLINAVFALSHEDDLPRLLARVRALEDFLASDDGANLLIAYRRAANIVRIEEKKDGQSHEGAVAADLLRDADEQVLFAKLETAVAETAAALDGERFDRAMAAIAALRRPVDAFFDHVTVNCADPDLRANRLRLLARIRRALHAVADFSLIEG